MKSGPLEKIIPDYDAKFLAELIGLVTDKLPVTKETCHLLRQLRRCSVEYRLAEIRERKLAREVDTLRRIAEHLRGPKP